MFSSRSTAAFEKGVAKNSTPTDSQRSLTSAHWATVLESHITFDKRMFGPDAKASLTVDEFEQLVLGVRFMEDARREGPEKVIDESKHELRRMFGKALAVNRDLQAGDTLRFEDLESKKPADGGLPVGKMHDVVGQKLNKPKKRWDFLTPDDLV